MTIASAIDDVIIAQGGTPDHTDTIADSLVNLAGVLAGENYPKDKTIEDAVTLLGEHIGGGGTEYGSVVLIFPRLNGEPFDELNGLVLSEIGDAERGNIMGDLKWWDTDKHYDAYGNVNVGIIASDNYTATIKVNDGDPQPVSKFYNDEWESYTYAFTVPNVTQEDYVYLDFAE